MPMKNLAPRWRAVVSLLALLCLLNAHAASSGGLMPHLFLLAICTAFVVLLAHAAVADNLGWPVGRP